MNFSDFKFGKKSQFNGSLMLLQNVIYGDVKG